MISSDPSKKDIVARRAYEIWQSRGHPHGQDQDHWLMAERELTGMGMAEASRPKRKARNAANGPSAARKTLSGRPKKARS
ncbi:MAG: DUF2934 domain-containing protein [Cucumibacter sp.]